MARKRKLDASVPEEALEGGLETDSARKGAMGGMWAGSAMNMLKQRIDDAHGSLRQGIIAGTVALELNPGQIRDDLGSDRVLPWQEDDDFEALVANIGRRGQTQPIRVRPVDPDWQPSDDKPLETKDEFVIQSGRRRLEACRRLGRKVLAIVATTEGDKALADLEERFHENTMRRNLNGFEELVSIGLLASALRELTQAEIAERLGVGQGDVSLGLGCLQWRNAILRQVDIANTPKRAYRAILPKIKRDEPLSDTAKAEPSEKQAYDVRGIPMIAKKSPKGYTIQMKETRVADEHLETMLVELAKVVMKYQIKTK